MLTEQVTSPETTKDVAAISDGKARRLANLKMIPKGTSLNPRGRPKKDLDLAKMAQEHAEKAVLTLAQCLSEPTASWPAKVSAASELLDRGFGKAPADLKVKHEIGFSEQFEALIREIDANRAKVIEHVSTNE